MKYRVKDLDGADLNRAVALALGLNVVVIDDMIDVMNKVEKPRRVAVLSRRPAAETNYIDTYPILDYAGDITHAWPLIKQYGISLTFNAEDYPPWFADMQMLPHIGPFEGFDPQVLAMQLLVASKFGDHIEMAAL